jgi:hypothetical protein
MSESGPKVRPVSEAGRRPRTIRSAESRLSGCSITLGADSVTRDFVVSGEDVTHFYSQPRR